MPAFPADPLGVLRSTARVMDRARHVRIDQHHVRALANELATATLPGWDSDLHYRATGPEAAEQTAIWIMTLDALNFCFWGQQNDPQRRWRVTHQGELIDGYAALVASLTRAAVDGAPLHDARWLANIPEHEVAAILRPAPGHDEIPLFPARVAHLRELGRGLLALRAERPATTLIRLARGTAPRLVRQIIHRFPSFNDTAIFHGGEVRFYKRAQILVADLAGGLAGFPIGDIHELDQLTAFADYKVPQILRQLGLLVYDDALATTIARRERIPPGDEREIEIRAATIQACEAVR